MGNPAAPGGSGACNREVLLAEDNEFSREVTSALLARLGWRVTPAVDGVQAVQLFHERHFDLVLMDLNLPGMDGFEATRRIRALERGRRTRTPVFALTAHDGGAETSCRAAGLDDLLVKPVTLRSLSEAMARFSAGDGDGTAPTDSSPPPAGPQQGSTLLSERILADFSGYPEQLSAFQTLLCADLDRQCLLMERACSVGDCTLLRDAAHTVRGLARGLRDPSLHLRAAEMETMAGQGDISGAAAKLAACLEAYRVLRNGLLP